MANVDWYASAGKADFRKMLSATLTFEPTNLKMLSVSCGSSNE